MSRIDKEQKTNEEPGASAQNPEPSALVCTAGGTGSDHVAVHHVADIIRKGVPVNRILLLTLTNRTAKDVMEGIKKRVGHSVSALWCGTFYSVANRILCRHSERIGYKNDYVLFDTEDTQGIIKSVIGGLALQRRALPKPQVMQALFSLAANTPLSIEELIASNSASRDMYVAGILEVHKGFNERKKQLNGMDVDDILVNVLKLFRECPDIRELYKARFRYVVVDGFQDINHLQLKWVELLTMT